MSLVSQAPKVIAVSPEIQSELLPHSLVTLTFDMPVLPGSAQIFVGGSSCIHHLSYSYLATTTTPIDLESVKGLFATFRVPITATERLYVYLPAGAVVSEESQTDCEEYRFAPNMYWLTMACLSCFTH